MLVGIFSLTRLAWSFHSLPVVAGNQLGLFVGGVCSVFYSRTVKQSFKNSGHVFGDTVWGHIYLGYVKYIFFGRTEAILFVGPNLLYVFGDTLTWK